MIDAIVIGDGPGGLSAALFLAKNGKQVVVFGQDKTAMHAALLKNYLGITEIAGSDFQRTARAQVEGFGATVRDARVESVSRGGNGFEVRLEGGETLAARNLILSEGRSPRLAQQLGARVDAERGIEVDRDQRTSVPGCFAVGRSTRPGRSQAIISAGDGAVAAIAILSEEKGEPFCDWDSP